MTIGAASSSTPSSSNPLTSLLQTQGLSASKIDLVETDLDKILEEAGSNSDPSSKVDAQSVRAALDKAISADVKSGKLSQADADKIGKALDQMDAAAAAQQGAEGPVGSPLSAEGMTGAPGGGAGGGSANSEKTEISRTVTVSGGIKTTVIVYSDGTSDTETSVDFSGQDSKAKPASAAPSDDKDHAAKAVAAEPGTAPQADLDPSVKAYLSTIRSGSLFNTYI